MVNCGVTSAVVLVDFVLYNTWYNCSTVGDRVAGMINSVDASWNSPLDSPRERLKRAFHPTEVTNSSLGGGLGGGGAGGARHFTEKYLLDMAMLPALGWERGGARQVIPRLCRFLPVAIYNMQDK